MVFVDELAYYLFVVSFSALVLGYFLIKFYVSYRRNKLDIKPQLEALSIPLLIVGGFMLVSATASQLLWLLPGAFNILYFDPMAAFGLVLVAFSLCLRYKAKTQYVGLLALLFGVMAVWYGICAYNLRLSNAPFEMFLLFVFFGLAGVFTYPATVVLDNMPRSRKATPASWVILLALLCVFLVASGVLAFYIGASAVPAHLASPP